MAKVKSNKITIEEALVPVEEQPYEVPENWCWIYGNAIMKDMETKKPVGDFFGYIDIDSIDNKNQKVTEAKKTMTAKAPSRASRKLQFGDTVFSMVRPYLKNIAYITEDLSDCIASTGFYICSPEPIVDSRYLYYLMISPYVVDGLNAFMKGDNSPSIRKDDVEMFKYPVPPIPEQKRIVEQIESLFSKLDEAKEKVEAALESYEQRTAAIYQDAFIGKLTSKWREENHIPSEWGYKRFDEVAEIKSNLVDPAEYKEYPHIAPDNIEKRTGVLLEYRTIEEDGVTSGKHRFYPGQILYSKIRPYLSKVTLVDFDGLCSADMYPIEAKGNVEFLFHYMLSDGFLMQASSAGSRSVLPKINQKELSALKVAYTSIEEQDAVVDILERILPLSQQARESTEQVLEQIDTVKKSILTKAFRGELETNDPTEESSVELLKQIIES